MNNIYLIIGSSKKIINNNIKEIMKDNKAITYDFENTDIKDIISEASYYSMFNDLKYIVVKNSHLFKMSEDETNLLIKYLEHPNPSSILIFTSNDKLDNRKKITKILKDKYKIIELKEMYKKDLIQIVNEYVKDNKYTIDYKSVNYIIDSCLNNYDLIINELDKIFLYYNKPTDILYDDVVGLVAPILNDNSFKFIEAVINKDLKLSFKIYDELVINKVEPISLIILLAREYRLIYRAKCFYEMNPSIYYVASEMKMVDWQVEKHLENSSRYSKKELKDNLRKLAKLDLEIKSGKIDRFLGLEQFILEYLSN